MASSISGRALHHVFKIGNRAATMDFYRNILGMKVNTEGGLIVNCNQWESESNLISDAVDGDERTNSSGFWWVSPVLIIIHRSSLKEMPMHSTVAHLITN